MERCNECPNFYWDEDGIPCCLIHGTDIPFHIQRYAVKLDNGDVQCFPFSKAGFESAQGFVKRNNPNDKVIYTVSNS